MKRLLMVFVLFFMFYCQAWGAYEKSGIVYYPTDGTSAAALLVGIEAKGTPCTMKFVHTSGVSTNYAFPSGVTFPAYVTTEIEDGAQFSGATILYDNSGQIKAASNQQIIDTETGAVLSFQNPCTVYAGWLDNNVGDGSTDVTAAYNAAIYSIKDVGGTVVVPDGISMIEPMDWSAAPTGGVRLYSNMKLIFETPTATLKATATDNDYGGIIMIAGGSSCTYNTDRIENVTVQGPGIIDGNRDNWTGSNDYSANIQVHGAYRVTLRDLTIQNASGDGITLDKSFGTWTWENGVCEEITIDNVFITDSRRNNLTVLESRDVYVSNTYLVDANGSSPAAGVDIEPDNAGDRNINFVNCVMSGNSGYGIALSRRYGDIAGTNKGTWDIKFTNCTIKNNGKFGAYVAYHNGNTYFTNCTFWRNVGANVVISSTNSGEAVWPVRIAGGTVQEAIFDPVNGDVSGATNVYNGHGIAISFGATESRQDGVIIDGVDIAYNDGHGILLSCNGNSYNKIINNHIYGSSQYANTVFSNIYLASDGADGTTILNNTIKKEMSVGNTLWGDAITNLSAYGIYGTTSVNGQIKIMDNDVASSGTTANIYFTGNYQNISSSYRNLLRNNAGFKTECTVLSAAVNAATTGLQSLNIAHGLAITPKVQDIDLSIIDDISGTPMSNSPIFQITPYVYAIDGTNIGVRYEIGTGGTGNFKIKARVLSGPYN